MKIPFAFIIVIVHLISCQGCNKLANDKDFRIDPKAREVVNNFYKWYIGDAYQKGSGYYQVPPFKRISDQLYVFDGAELEKRLAKVPFFSNEYRNQLVNKLKLCNAEMSKKIWEYEPEPQFDIGKCNYLWFDNWVGGQGESINDFRIIEENNHETYTEFLVEILIDKVVFVKSKVKVVKESDLYKIDNIMLVWD